VRLDTLAAAYAEAGEFEEAIRWQERAAALAPPEEQASYEEPLDLYRQGRPFRDQPAPKTEPQLPYPVEAFRFVLLGLQRVPKEAPPADGQTAHSTGGQLCWALRDLALELFGKKARQALASWNIHRTEDFGKIVFMLVEMGQMQTSEGDSPNDFVGVYDFETAFPDQ
jgi:uncharacterized repeat protein (TIGR04138 family)